MRYVILEERDDIEQRCLNSKCGFTNPVFEEPRSNCLRCCGPLGAFRAYGTAAERAVRLRTAEQSLRDWTG